MRAMLNQLKSASAAALFAFASLGAFATVAQAQTKVVLTQATQVGVYPSAGGLSGANTAGSTMGVNSLGNVIFGNSYGNDVLQLVPSTGAVTILGAPGNVGAVAVDASNNYYFTNLYQTAIVKVPFVAGTYAAFSANPSVKCVGGDTAACQIQGLTNGANGYYFGVQSLTFDSTGNLFFGLTNGNTAPNAIFECTVACQTGNGTATLLYQEPTNAAAQLTLGGLATDATGNLFFTDSAEPSNQISTRSNLNELVYTAGTGYATAPTVLYAYVPGPNATGGDQIDTVAVDAANVYFATTNGGIFAMPNAKGVVNKAALFAVSNQGAKIMATDGKGKFFADMNLPGGDVIEQSAVGTITAPPTNVGSSAKLAGVTTLLNDGACTSAGVTYVSTSAEYTANATGSTCATVFGLFGSFATNVNFTPAAGGTRAATLTATDGIGSSGTAALTGSGVSFTVATPTFSPAGGTYTSAQTVALSDATTSASIYYTTDGSTPTTASTLYTAPLTISATQTVKAIGAATGAISSAVASAAYTINLPAGTPTFTPAAGTYTSVQTVTIASSTTGAAIYYTTNGTAPTTTSTLYTGPVSVGVSETLQAIATAAGSSTSAIGSAAYILNLPAGTPTFTPAAGTYTTVQTVAITSATAGATIYYTINGTAPTTASTVYTGPITVGVTQTVMALATATGFTPSALGSAVYTINLPPPSFTMAINPNSLTIKNGATGNVAIVVTPANSFAGQVTFGCSGLPADAACSFSPVPLSVAGAPATSTLTIITTTVFGATRPASLPWLPGTGLVAAFSLVFLRKRRRVRALFLVLIGTVGLGMVSGCGVTPTPSITHTPTASVVTVTATAGTVISSANFTLNIQ